MVVMYLAASSGRAILLSRREARVLADSMWFGARKTDDMLGSFAEVDRECEISFESVGGEAWLRDEVEAPSLLEEDERLMAGGFAFTGKSPLLCFRPILSGFVPFCDGDESAVPGEALEGAELGLDGINSGGGIIV